MDAHQKVLFVDAATGYYRITGSRWATSTGPWTSACIWPAGTTA